MTQDDAAQIQTGGLEVRRLLGGVGAQGGVGVDGHAGLLRGDDGGVEDLALGLGHGVLAGADLTDHTGLGAVAVDAGADLADHPVGHLLHGLAVHALGQEGLFIKTGGLDDPDAGLFFHIQDVGNVASHAVVGHVHNSADAALIELLELRHGLGIAVELAVGVFLHTGEVDGDVLMHQSIAVHWVSPLCPGWLSHRVGGEKGGPGRVPPLC